MDVKVDENSSRSEKILGKMAGKYSGELEEPQSRIEALLSLIKVDGGSAQVDLSEYAKKSDLEKLTTTTQQATKQEEELSVDYPKFILVNSKDEMTDKSAIYLLKENGAYSVYIYTKNWQTDATEFTAYGTVSNDLSKYKPIDAMVSFIWSFTDPRAREDD